MAYSIMVVDDSETIRSMLERSLLMSGLPLEKIVQAKNGKEALEKLKAEWVDIVLTDIHMPEMDGIALFDTMRQNPELANIPVVVVSTEGSKVRIEELKKKGIRGYLRKPFTPEKIREVIVEILGEWNGHGK